MAVPSSGPIGMQGIANELLLGDYYGTGPTFTSISLWHMNQGLGDFVGSPINQSSPDKPNGSAPHTMSEFLGYDHDYVAALTFNTTTTVGYYTNPDARFDMYSILGNRAYTDPSNTDNPDPVVLSNTYWREFTFRVSAGQSVLYRPIIIFRAGGTSFQRDFALNSFRVNNSTLYHPEVTTAQYATNLSNDTVPATWSNITFGGSNGIYNVTSGGTPSNDTGPEAGYVWNDFIDDYATSNQYAAAPCDYWYFEASGTTNGWIFFRLPSRAIGGGSTDEWKFIYSAWSDDVSTWQSSYYEIQIEVMGII